MKEEELAQRIKDLEKEINRRLAGGGEPGSSSNRQPSQVASRGPSHHGESQNSRPAASGTGIAAGSIPRSTRSTEGSRTSSRPRNECPHCDKCRKGNGRYEHSWGWTVEDVKLIGGGRDGWNRPNKKINIIVLGPGEGSTSWTSSSWSSCALCESGNESKLCSECKKGDRSVGGGKYQGGAPANIHRAIAEARRHIAEVMKRARAGQHRGYMRMEAPGSPREGGVGDRPNDRPVVIVNDEWPATDGRTREREAKSERRAAG